jgi:hypothetical protein
VHIHVNGKIIPVENIPGTGLKENGRGGEFKV